MGNSSTGWCSKLQHCMLISYYRIKVLLSKGNVVNITFGILNLKWKNYIVILSIIFKIKNKIK